MLSCIPYEGRISGIVDVPNACATLAIPLAFLIAMSVHLATWVHWQLWRRESQSSKRTFVFLPRAEQFPSTPGLMIDLPVVYVVVW
jgi:hypothetical protein